MIEKPTSDMAFLWLRIFATLKPLDQNTDLIFYFAVYVFTSDWCRIWPYCTSSPQPKWATKTCFLNFVKLLQLSDWTCPDMKDYERKLFVLCTQYVMKPKRKGSRDALISWWLLLQIFCVNKPSNFLKTQKKFQCWWHFSEGQQNPWM